MPNILVIEDEQHLRATILETLEFEGFETLEAEDGRVGIQAAKKYRPDLILCDILMPELDGYDVLQEIRNDPQTAAIPFIFLTSQAAQRDLRKGMNSGADDYLTKPFEVDDLLSAINTRLEKHQTLSEHTSQQLERLRLHLSSSLPHELRTPLHEILGGAQFLKEFGTDLIREPDTILEVGQGLEQSARRLQRLIENYLLYTDLTLKKYVPGRTSPCPEKELLETKTVIAYVAKRKAEAVQRTQDISLQLQEVPLMIPTQCFYKILDELLDNAFKYSDPGTSVRVTSKEDANTLSITISDQGRGMTQRQIEALGAYMQFDRAKYEQQGMGLGFAIARLLTELHGGILEISSQQKQGTTVRLLFDSKE